MHSRLLVLLAATALAVPATAVAFGTIELLPATNDGSYESTCNFVEPTGPGLRNVQVVITFGGGDTFLGVDHFRVYQTGINWIPLAVISPYWTVIGGSFDDSVVSFGSCIAPPVIAATLQYLQPSSQSPCGRIWLAPVNGGDILVKCDASTTPTQLVGMTVNGVYDVPPGGFDPDCYCPALASEPSSWGKVKALYRN